jgi:DNA polymerase III epsilon subunit-like protein
MASGMTISLMPRNFGELAPPFLEAIQGRTLFTHNASFDLAQLNRELTRIRRRKLATMGCTLALGMHLGFGRLSLTKAVEQIGLSREMPYVALDDARAAAELLRRYMKHNLRRFKEYLQIQGL